MKVNSFFYLPLLLLIFACGKDDRDNTTWLIPSDEVFDGGPGKDGIPSIDSPNFSSISQIDFLNETDLVVGVVVGEVAKAYPHDILDQHEIVNDEIGGAYLALTYCPLTGTAIGWDREINGSITEFGVSGKLYNSNLIPYDRLTDSYWSQINLNCVNGNLAGESAKLLPVIETTWATWKEMYPDSEVLNTNTGFNRNYGNYPYGDYITNNSNFLFPVNNVDNRLPSKKRALAILADNVERAYSLDLFETSRIIEDNLDANNILVIGSKVQNYIVAYNNDLDLVGLELVGGELPVIAIDQNGNELRIDGSIAAGPLAGQSLSPTKSFIGYWFSLGAFYPAIELFE